ncbi:MAG: rhamnulokinase [Gemmatimonadetes bacterium]|nr:rhamnulokinase [Gemmatimonadota bacterium]
MATRYLAIDLGAASGRAVLGTLHDGRVELEEVHRFATPLVDRGGHLFWDLEELWAQVREGVRLGLEAAPDLRGVSVDSWAVDYVPVDRDGRPLRDPYSYRDPRTAGMMARAFAAVPPKELYRRTGIQMQPFNTIFQLLADVEGEPEVVRATAHRLLIADYLLFRLSGRAVAERTMASTTQLMDALTGWWDTSLLERLRLPLDGWAPIVQPGTRLGMLAGEGMTAREVAVIASCSHDTAAAVAGTPADVDGPPWAYLSTGTWSLLGTERREPILTEAARAANFTNEAGLDGTIRFLKNLMGMWILQECERDSAEGGAWDPATIIAEARAADSPERLIDVHDPRFAARGDMTAKVLARCAEDGVRPPKSRGELVRLLLESLAAAYGEGLRQIEALTGERIRAVHMVGGASRNDLLCELTANACGCVVLAGPVEATALGNVLVQARALGDLPPGSSVRDVARASAAPREHHPRRMSTTSLSSNQQPGQ